MYLPYVPSKPPLLCYNQPMENQLERGPERIPNKAEVLEIITRHAKEAEIEKVVRELDDEQGLYLLEVRVKGENKSGETTQYEYRREGSFQEHQSVETSLDVVYYNGAEVVWAKNIAFYRPQTGAWDELE